MKNSENDYALVELIEIINQTDSNVSLTVTVDGGAISGRLVSNERWFKSRADVLKGGDADEDGEVGLHTLYERWGTTFAELNKQAKEVRDLDVPEQYKVALDEVSKPGYLHLIDAVLVGAGRHTGVPFAFRVDLSRVSAWSFGQIS
ncbi:hypothetical protein [Streptomyces venezuelae]|uniref:hypothetical protein n=1 Tax=Streptomyces venezuelae TaxID=54571 RepID=UPI00362D4931